MKFIPIGRVTSFHGIKGEIKFKYYNEVSEGLSSYTSFFTLTEKGYFELYPAEIRYRQGIFYILFRGFENRDAVAFLHGKELLVREEDLPVLSDCMYYDYQLMGLKVLDASGIPMGSVTEIYHTRAGDILVVHGEREWFIPMSEENIAEIDVQNTFIRLTRGALLE